MSLSEMKRKIVTVTAPSGGCGVSVMAKELACYFGRKQIMGKHLRVCLLDLHNSGGAQNALMEYTDIRYDLSDLVRSYRSELDQSPQALKEKYRWDEKLEKYITEDPVRGIFVLPAPETELKPHIKRSEAEFIIDSLSEYFDLILIDAPRGITNASLAAIDRSTSVLFLLRNDMDCIEQMLSYRKDLLQNGFLDVIKDKSAAAVNMDHASLTYMKPREIEEYIGLPVIEDIPYYAPAWTFSNIGTSMALGKTPVTASYRRIASWILPEIEDGGRR